MHTTAAIHIVGAGIVGGATGNALESLGHEVRYVDNGPARRRQLEAMGKRVSDKLELPNEGRSVVFVCVPTPSSAQGYDLAHLRNALAETGSAIGRSQGWHVVATRSTVAPLTWNRVVIPELERASGRRVGDGFEVASVPEFLRQVSATEDALSPKATVVAAQNRVARELLVALLAPLGGKLIPLDDPTIAETIKIASNCFNAAKISFHNEIWQVCRQLGIPQDVVGQVVSEAAEGSYNPGYGIVGGYPYGGACLPKDVDGLLGFGIEEGMDLPLLNAVREVNFGISSSVMCDRLSEVVEAVGQADVAL